MKNDKGEISIKILGSLFLYLEEQYGKEAKIAVLKAGNLTEEDLLSKDSWVLHEEFEDMLSKANSYFKDEEEFKEACAYKLNKSYGLLKYLFWGISIETIFKKIPKAYPAIINFAKIDIVVLKKNYSHFKYISKKQESRLMCIARQAQSEGLPTIWNLPKTKLKEKKCIAWGDDCCEYELTWKRKKSWWPTFLGLILGLFLGFIISLLNSLGDYRFIFISLFGGAIGFLWESLKTEKDNQVNEDVLQEKMLEMAKEEAEARQELGSLRKREKIWIKEMEHQLQNKEILIQNFIANIEDTAKEKEQVLRGISHDFRGPLGVVRFGAHYIIEQIKNNKEIDPEVVKVQKNATEQLEELLVEFMTMAKTKKTLRVARPEELIISDIADMAKKRTEALCFGKNIRVSLIKKNNLPETISIDPLFLDRVMDNLITNAAKFTEEGSIIIEYDSDGEFLIIKISDSGCGMSQERMHEIFNLKGVSPDKRVKNSFGLGLANVVKLLWQMGGEIEVTSEENKGSTFFVYLPLKASERPDSVPPHEIVEQVVTIREDHSSQK